MKDFVVLVITYDEQAVSTGSKDEVLELTNADWSLGGQPRIRANSGMFAAARPLAANAGAEILRRDENAFDAVAATAVAVNVVKPFMSGLDGAGRCVEAKSPILGGSCLTFP